MKKLQIMRLTREMMMVQFESRATIGLVAPDSRPAIPGPIYGTGVHYVGGDRLGLFRAHHTKCREKQRDIQFFHMETREWADFAYTFSVCPHDIVLAGRGAGVRTAANGTKWGNDHWYAGLFLVGGDEEPTDGMLRAFTEAVNGLKAPSLRPHSGFKSTACPGDPTRSKIVDGAFFIEEEDIMASVDELRQVIQEELGIRTLNINGADTKMSRLMTDSIFRAGWGRTTIQTFEDRFTEMWLGIRAQLSRDGALTEEEETAIAEAVIDSIPDHLAQQVLDGLKARL